MGTLVANGGHVPKVPASNTRNLQNHVACGMAAGIKELVGHGALDKKGEGEGTVEPATIARRRWGEGDGRAKEKKKLQPRYMKMEFSHGARIKEAEFNYDSVPKTAQIRTLYSDQKSADHIFEIRCLRKHEG